MFEIRAITNENDIVRMRQLLDALGERLGDLTPVMRQIAGTMHDAVEENFTAGGRPRWKPSQRVVKHGGQTLIDKGLLVKSISEKADSTSARVGTNKAQAAALHFGFDGMVSVKAHSRKVKSRNISTRSLTTKKAVLIAAGVGFVKAHTRHMKLPPRPFMMLTPEDIAVIKEDLKNYVVNGR